MTYSCPRADLVSKSTTIGMHRKQPTIDHDPAPWSRNSTRFTRRLTHKCNKELASNVTFQILVSILPAVIATLRSNLRAPSPGVSSELGLRLLSCMKLGMANKRRECCSQAVQF